MAGVPSSAGIAARLSSALIAKMLIVAAPQPSADAVVSGHGVVVRHPTRSTATL